MRRQLGIPNPAAQIAVCQDITDHWGDYNAVMSGSPLSLSTPAVSKFGRAVGPSTDFNELPATRAARRSNRRFGIRTDVAQFYNSIYTHSIPWAVHGRTNAKAAFKTRTSVVGDGLDRAVREGQEGQTIGIPIGPDTSLIVGELILRGSMRNSRLLA